MLLIIQVALGLEDIHAATKKELVLFTFCNVRDTSTSSRYTCQNHHVYVQMFMDLCIHAATKKKIGFVY